MLLMGTRERWDETYRILLPHALRSVEDRHREFREAVFHAWLFWHGETTDEQLDALLTYEQYTVLRTLEEACSRGWRDALLGRMLTEHGYEATGRPFGGPHGLWGAPARADTEHRFRPLHLPPRPWGAHPPVRLRDALSRVRNTFTLELGPIRDAHAAVTAVPLGDRPPIDHVREVVRRLCLNAWHREVGTYDRRHWDDAEWWQYLELVETLPWMAVALGLPGENPDVYGDLVERVASATVPEPRQAWTSQAIPAEFIPELGSACVALARKEAE
jgi:hypothetical protein